MTRFLLLVAATGLVLVTGCKPRSSTDAPASTPADQTNAPPRVAVLYFEEIADRAPGGLSVHADQLERLAAALREKGLPAEVALIPADDDQPHLSPKFDAAIALDVPDYRPGDVRMMDDFVREGGTLLVIGPPGAAGGLLGVESAGDSPLPRTGASRVVRGGPPFADTAPTELDWGPLATWRWPVRAQDTVIRVADSEGAPVLTEHTAGAGKAWLLAVLPPGRMFNGWASAPNAVAAVAEIVRSAPARNRADTPAPMRVGLSANMIAFGEGQWPTRVIARIRGGTPSETLAGTFEARDAENNVALKGNLQTLPARWRSRFLYADLAKLPPGEYRVAVTIPPLEAVTVNVRRGEDALNAAIVDGLGAWLDAQDFKPPAEDTPVTPREIEDRALLAWALARAAEIPGSPERYRYDLERLAYWFRTAAPHLFRDPAAPASALGAMSAGLARAIGPIRRDSSMHLAREIQLMAEQSYAMLATRGGEDLSVIGARLWAAAELHRATQITDYRVAADAAAKVLFARQLDRGRSVEGDVFGDFFVDALRTALAPADGSRARGIGFLLGLVALENIAEPGPFKIDLGAVLDRHARGLLLGGAALNPYGAFPAGLEAAEPPKPRADGRGMAAPDKFRTRAYAREASDAVPGVEAVRIALAVVAMERYLVTGETALLRAAKDQINHLLGANPEGRRLWRDGLFLNGPIGRGPERIPVWRADYSEAGEALPGNAWLLALHALLTGGRP